ncbi:hypothetical protein SteCoe_8887 [Stentor coeruleus]|uniref:Uncharacterized protein n=1 Tax=Stentor coeruleus TaxID=5963 RepID=A0A1R2CJ90_9CILI|nr:hypothetical protein SteCoe_8887 [Stentor coeruleus]
MASSRLRAEAINTCYMLRPKHPKVLEALQRYNNISPCKVVSDIFQPKTGDLHEGFLADESLNVSCQTCPKVKKSIPLSMGSSMLYMRRNRK